MSLSQGAKAALLVAAMWFAYFLNYSDRQAVSALFPVLRKELSFTEVQLGLTSSIFLWVYGLCAPIAGQFGDRYSKRWLVVMSLALWSVVTLLTGFSKSVVMLLALRALMGISESLFMPSAIALTANAYEPGKRSQAIAILTTAQIVGVIGGSSFGGWMGDHGHWRSTFYVLGAVGLIYAVPYFLFLRTVNEETEEETKKSGATLAVAGLIKSRTYLLLCVVFPIFVFGLWLLYGWLPDFLKSKFNLSLTDAAINVTVFLQGSTIVGLLCGGALADWLYSRTPASRLWLLTASCLLCAPCLYALGHSETLLGTRIAAAAFGLSAGFLQGNIFPAAFEVVPADTRASAVGILNLCGSLVSGCATLFGGMWKKTIGIAGLLGWTALLYVVGGLLLIAGIKLLFKHDFERVRLTPAKP